MVGVVGLEERFGGGRAIATDRRRLRFKVCFPRQAGREQPSPVPPGCCTPRSSLDSVSSLDSLHQPTTFRRHPNHTHALSHKRVLPVHDPDLWMKVPRLRVIFARGSPNVLAVAAQSNPSICFEAIVDGTNDRSLGAPLRLLPSTTTQATQTSWSAALRTTRFGTTARGCFAKRYDTHLPTPVCLYSLHPSLLVV